MWLLDSNIFKAMQKAVELGFNPTSEQITEFEARRLESSEGGSRILSTAGSNAEIKIEGVLTNKPSFLAMIFGGGNATYKEVMSAFAEADANPEVKTITMAIDSPGGSVDGLFDTLAAIEAVKKPINAVVSNRASSAAYAIASKAYPITAKNRAVSVGSIGIVTTFFKDEDKISITSDKAPNKRPDVSTKEGVKVIKEELNALHELFAESIATGRKTTVQKVNSNFGKGSMLFADDALKAGMIDNIAGTDLKIVPKTKKTATAGKRQGAFMDLATLKAEHPDVYKAAVEDGKTIGKAEELDRVSAHLIMGEQSGAIDTAIAAIKGGESMTATLQATYMTAGMNRSDVDDKDKDDKDADPGKPKGDDIDAKAEDDKILETVKSQTGFKEVS